ncbi:MAG: hypothetical protein NTV03_00055 [Candidatus Nomurabacteria bacterium]|nr:hypothetical protein [Candidatus Nomurabacteria bacterium]
MGLEAINTGAPAPQEESDLEKEIKIIEGNITLKERVLDELSRRVYELRNNYPVDGFEVVEYKTTTNGTAEPTIPQARDRREKEALEIETNKMPAKRDEIKELKENLKKKLQG